MTKSGLADSPFFASPAKKIEQPIPPLQQQPEKPVDKAVSPPPVELEIQNNQPIKREKPVKARVNNNERNDTVIPRNHDATVSRYRDTTTPRIHGVAIEIVRKAVKEFGKEAATHRFTESEKREIADLIYTYKNRGVKTNENEITRIAVNFIMEDYKENGENSVLHKILEALNE